MGSIGESMGCVCYCPAGSECCSHHRGLDKLYVRCTRLARVTAVDIDAIRALSSESDGDRDQLLILHGIAPSATAALSNAQNAFITSGARLSIFFSLPRLFLLYINWCQLRLGVREKSQSK